MSVKDKVIPTLQKKYNEETVPSLMKRFSYKNIMQVPRFEKIVINIGIGKAIQNRKLLDEAIMCLTDITGQKPVIRKAKKAISNFKLRKGMEIGCSVTLRSEKMYEFLDRLIAISIPRVRDFRGLSKKSFDGNGNYSFGIKEQIVFMEVNRDKISEINGMDITICTSASEDSVALGLLEEIGMPFKN